MFRRWVLCIAVVATLGAVGVLGWNEYRLHSRKSAPAPLQLPRPVLVVSTDVKTGEEVCDLDVIDLTVLVQKDTPEPPLFVFEVPDGLPATLDFPTVPATATPADVTAFLPHSADGAESLPKPPAGKFWKRLAGWFQGKPLDGEEPCEALPIMPRPATSSHYPHESCPYHGGCPYDGAHYRHAVMKPIGSGEETQSAPPTARKPKLDTMEVRPGDIQSPWYIRPF